MHSKFNSCEPYIKRDNDGKFIIFSGLPEFGYELISVIPFAHYLHEKKLLKKTISSIDTKSLYFFSKCHEEIKGSRSYDNVLSMKNKNFPNIDIHKNQLDWAYFSPPKYKEYYKNKLFNFNKEILIISNRICNEWNGQPLNYIDSKLLNKIFNLLKNEYQIIYISTSHFPKSYEDHIPFSDCNFENDINYDGVIKFSDLLKKYKNFTINELQCLLYSGCNKFISSNGGLGILSSYFGGENIIYTKKCHELHPDVNSFYSWYSRFSSSVITVCSDDDELLKKIKIKFIEKKPLFNILIRTNNRPNYFHDCIKSVLDQSYSNINIIVGYDDNKSLEYIQKFPCVKIPLKKWSGEKPVKPSSDEYGIWFPYNIYFNDLLKFVYHGYIIYLDDDDKLFSSDSLEYIYKLVKNNCDSIFWRVKFPTRIVPSDINFEKKIPIVKDISTIGFSHSSKIKVNWEPWKRGDFRVAKYIWKESKKTIWANAILSTIQRNIENGYGSRDDKENIETNYRPKINIIISAYQAEDTIETCIRSIINQKKFRNYIRNVYIGVDGCNKTIEKCKKLQKKVSSNVKFYYVKNNVGPYLIRNSLVKLIPRRDDLILFFDADDIMPQYFIDCYYRRFILEYKKHKQTIIRSNCINVKKDELIKYSYNDYILEKIEYEGCRSYWGDILLMISRHTTLMQRYNKKYNTFRDSIINTKCQILLSVEEFYRIGGFNEYKIAQDADLLSRAELLNSNIITDNELDFFIRIVLPNSLEHSIETCMNSDYRKTIKEKNKSLIKNGILKSPFKTVYLKIIL
ncbi:glycosyltransferase family A protein [Desulfovibrio sp. ZJ369]|uniref:glycosyltransferase family 2 protein n=1 Tax=Desulfovibrio sp. ZJ369 TaxID=2709793 RepID=UPI0013EA0A35|nr:glycosyltransferase family A protein [Desulfovibrio sp. ZJ369]